MKLQIKKCVVSLISTIGSNDNKLYTHRLFGFDWQGHLTLFTYRKSTSLKDQIVYCLATTKIFDTNGGEQFLFIIKYTYR